jgi:dihydroorotase
MYDCVLKGGRIIDPSQNIDDILDLAIEKNKISSLDKDIDPKTALQVFYLKEKLVVPGLIDLHTHVYWKGSSISVSPDEIAPKSGITTMVDAGSTGAGNYLAFKDYIIESSICNIFTFLNIAYAGIPYVSKYLNFSENQFLETLNIASLVDTIKTFSNNIIGIKVRLGVKGSGKSGLLPLLLALKASEITEKPLMVHIGDPPPAIQEILPYLRKGDIVTHSFRGGANKFLDNKGNVISEVWKARERGVLFDVGHGKGSFSFKTAKDMINANFYPDTISTDMHSLSIKHVIDLPTTMSKFINLGMSLPKVIHACTYTPASVISQEPKIGQLREGSVADISVFELTDSEYKYFDSYNNILIGNKKLVPIMTLKNGQLIYPINL